MLIVFILNETNQILCECACVVEFWALKSYEHRDLLIQELIK